MSVGVIVVHGVADQQPDESAAQIVDLLANLDVAGSGSTAYGPFVLEKRDLPVRPLPPPPAPTVKADDATTFRERSVKLQAAEHAAANFVATSVDEVGSAPPVDVNIEFMTTLIAGYEPQGPDETYSTVVRKTTRRARAATNEAAVEASIYEMYWADLSRLSTSWLRIFAELYQLMFHLGSLGLHTISAARVAERANAKSRTWAMWQWTQAAAVNAVAIGMVVPNLMFAGLLGILLLRFVPRTYWNPDPRLVGTVGFVVAAFALDRLLKAYAVFRPHVRQFAAALGGAIAVPFFGTLYGIWPPGVSEPLLQAAVLRAGEVTFVLLSLAWGWMTLNMVGTALLGWLVMGAGKATPIASRVQWTAILTLVLQALTFSILTIVLWGAVTLAVTTSLPDFAWPEHPAFIVGRLFPHTYEATVGGLVHSMILEAAGLGFGLTALMTGLAVLIVLFYIFPAAKYEASPGPEGVPDTRGGRRLTQGFRRMRVAGWIVIVATVIVLPAGTLVSILPMDPERLSQLTWFRGMTENALAWSGKLIVLSAVGLTAFRNRLKGLFLHLRGGLDIALDVDNYLREHPRGRTPRARIVSRYVSLLRHVLAQGHDRIVIISHSQGTVITADLLRYLRWQELKSTGYLASTGLDGLNHTPIRFFTMGCPLRQLYGLRFPHLYQWARYAEAPNMPNAQDSIPLGTAPLPTEIGVETWVNAYRSADYVGRQLWRPDDCSYLFDARAVSSGAHPWPTGTIPSAIVSIDAKTPASRREFCIGRGAHTHYWDGSAPQIAQTLDGLIGA